MFHYVDCRLRLHSSDSTRGKIHIVSEQQCCIRLHLQPSGKWLRCPFKAKQTIVSPNNPQSDTGSDTQDTNTMTSAAAGSWQQNGGSMEQWENVPVCYLELPNTHKYTNTYNADVEKDLQVGPQTQILYKKTSHLKLSWFTHRQNID